MKDMKIEIKNEDEKKEMLRALRLLENYPLPDVVDLSHIKKQLERS